MGSINDGRGLHHEEVHLAARMAAYYSVLNEDPEFRAELRRLYEQLGSSLAAGYRFPSPEELRILDEFVDHWRLPGGDSGLGLRYGALDLWDSLSQAASGGASLRLTLGQRAWMESDVGTTVAINEPVSTASGRQVTATERVSPTIWPTVPLPFDYDPMRVSPAWVREHAERVATEVRDSIIRQAEKFERQARDQGYRPVPPGYRQGEDLRRVASRLYQRAVLGRSWSQIKASDDVEMGTVRRTVERWAEELVIPLPRR